MVPVNALERAASLDSNNADFRFDYCVMRHSASGS